METMVKSKTNGSRNGRARLGECLLAAGVIDQKTLDEALEMQKASERRLGQILIGMGAVDEFQIAHTLAGQLKIPYIRLRSPKIPDDVIRKVPWNTADMYNLVPVKIKDNELYVAMEDPLNVFAVDDVRFASGMKVRRVAAPRTDILHTIEKYYHSGRLAEEVDKAPAMDDLIELIPRANTPDKETEQLEVLSTRSPIIKLVNAILADAIKLGASDIHVEPQLDVVVVRYRVDGIMRETMRLDKHLAPGIVSRIKVIGDLDISIRRKPQDGGAKIRKDNKCYDLRISTIPTSYGEKVVIRVLDPENANVHLEMVDLSDDVFAQYGKALSGTSGIVLVTGPTGSGKSTTLYASLKRLHTSQVNIVTVEDPVEYDMRGINQVQINPRAGITFASGLRSILRQDPDIIMVGEIRDQETAEIAFNAAQTGHLVLSTLHTNDAPSAVDRLFDLAVEPFLIASSLSAVVAQRLVRTVCASCKTPDPEAEAAWKQVAHLRPDVKNPRLFKGKGCEVCQFSGYSGRAGIFELISMTPALREVVKSGKGGDGKLLEIARKDGYRPLMMHGLEKVLAGVTTVEEVLRVAPTPADAPQTAKTTADPDSGMAVEETGNDAAPSAGARDAMKPPIGPARPKRILVADDSATVRSMLKHVLEAEGYDVLLAGDGLEALRTAHQRKPDLILLDNVMPQMTGLSVIKKLKSHLSLRYIPIIMITARDEVENEVSSLEAGADDYVTKPLEKRRLMARIRRYLN
ncbi:MAG: ATPase, T2SS/T4P/T4SS family [Desulfatibacillaceae bacterium]